MSGHVQPRGDGVWRIFVDDGRDPLTGRRRRITRTFRGSRKEAEREAEKFVTSVRDGRHGTAATTFGALLDAWLAHAEPNLGPWTLYHYRNKVETHIRPALGALKLRQLTTARLDAYYRALATRGSVRFHNEDGTPKALSAQSVKHIHTIIRRACTQGCKWGWLERNPADLAEPPSIPTRDPRLPPVASILSILDLLTPDMREVAWLAIVSGARRGELCGLQWSDIKLERTNDQRGGELTIRRAVADLPNEVVIKGTKTNKERTLALDAFTVELLAARHARQAEKALAFGTTLGPDAYVFADAPGAADPLRPDFVTKRWARAAQSAAVPCRFHDLRHASVSALLEAGFDAGGVAKRVGHASTKMTLDVYGHASGSRDLAAAEHLAGHFGAETR